jgi:hypothetical protein
MDNDFSNASACFRSTAQRLGLRSGSDRGGSTVTAPSSSSTARWLAIIDVVIPSSRASCELVIGPCTSKWRKAATRVAPAYASTVRVTSTGSGGETTHCKVVCRGALALTVLLDVREGTWVQAVGELRLSASEEDGGLVLATVDADRCHQCRQTLTRGRRRTWWTSGLTADADATPDSHLRRG